MSQRDRQRQKLIEQRQQWQDATDRIDAVIRQIGTTTDAEKLLTLNRRLQELQAERDALEPALQALEAEPEGDSTQAQETRSRQQITWLHISDLHFRAAQTYNASVVLGALLRDVAERIQQDGLRPDFIAVTGDVAFAGQPAEYALARRFFDDLLETTGLPRQRLFIVPGNHDIDRNLVTEDAKAIGDTLTNRDKVNALYVTPGDRRLLMARFRGYAEFVNDYLDHLAFDDEHYFYVHTLNLAGRQVALLGLNSAWLCASDEDKVKGVLIGEQQTWTALKQAQDADLKIALLHHPFGWLREFDQGDSADMLLDACDLILHGHRHQTATTQLISPDSATMVLDCGACYETRKFPNMFKWVKLDLATGNGVVYLRRYSDSRGGFWTKDTQTYRNTPDGEYAFALHAPARVPSKLPRPPIETKSVRPLETRSTHPRSITFASSLTGEPFSSITLPPAAHPRLTYQAPLAEDRFVGREQLIQALLAAAETTRIVAILGIPGIGKTALMKQIASCFTLKYVFWYDFTPSLFSLDDVLIQLARFLDDRPGYEGNLAKAIQAPVFLESDRINLIIRELNAGCYYLFFDSVHNIESHSSLDSFFSLLKEQLQQGAVFVAGRSKPVFYKSVDTARHLVESVILDGLSEFEASEFFAQNDITLTVETVETLCTRFGGLPLALELMVPLLTTEFTEAELLTLSDEAEEPIIDDLFDEVYERLDSVGKALLTTASLFNLPYSQSELLSAHRALFDTEGEASQFTKLRRQLLIQRFAPDVYQVHKVIRTLALKYVVELNQHRVRLADFLVAQMPDDPLTYFEAMLLYYQAEFFDRAAELAVPIVDRNLLPYDPASAETVLGKFEENMVSPERWMWLVGSQGALARFWHRLDQAEDHYRTMLRLAGELQDKAATAIAFQRLGIVYLDRDDKISEDYYLNSLALKKELGDLEGQAELYNNLGSLYTNRRQFADARSALEKGLAQLVKADAPEWQKLSLYANLGHLYAEEEQWDKAVELTERAREIAEEVESPYDVATTTHNLGMYEARQRNHTNARECYLQALEIARVYGFWKIEELEHIALGKLCHELGNYDDAVTHFQKVAEIQEKIDDKTKLGATYFDIGTFYAQKDDYQRTLGYYEKGIALFEHIEDEAQVQMYLTNVYCLAEQSAEPRRIVSALKRLKNHLLFQSPSYKLAKVYGTLGEIYLHFLHRDRVALACMRQAVELLAQLDRAQEQIAALTNLGSVYAGLERLGDALDAYTEAIDMAERDKLSHLVGMVYYTRANCYATLEMWPQAEYDYRRSLAIAEETDDTRIEAAVYPNLGEIYCRWGRPADAVELLRSSLVSARQRGDIETEIMTLNNLGLAYRASSQDQDALDSFHNALTLSRQYYQKRKESNVLIDLGNHYLEGNQPEKAKKYYEQALIAARAAEDDDLEEGSMLSLSYTHRQLGTFDEIAEDFKAVAERAVELKHYENLVQFTTFAGEINLEEGDTEAAVEMFEFALTAALTLGYSRFQQFKSHSEAPALLPELIDVILRICVSVDEALQNDAPERAQALYDGLLDRLHDWESWDETGLWMIDYLKPIGSYLAELPEQSIREYVVAAWNSENKESSDS